MRGCRFPVLRWPGRSGCHALDKLDHVACQSDRNERFHRGDPRAVMVERGDVGIVAPK